MKKRCGWCGTDPLYVEYHDNQWGIPVHNDTDLFEMLTLEGAQAGLSWLTILKKRENYRKALNNFNIETIACYSEQDIQRLLADTGIVRNRLKVESVIKNARAVLSIQEQHGTLDAFLWRYVDGEQQQNSWRSLDEIPAQTEVSVQLSKDLKRSGCNFVGPTICYAFMQAIGMVNDHPVDCFRYEEIRQSQG
jgi:DNA-3-methyladenine glycosylase I